MECFPGFSFVQFLTILMENTDYPYGQVPFPLPHATCIQFASICQF